MRIDFDETVPVLPEVVFDHLRSPREWPRLYGAFGEVRDLGQGWYAVPLAGSTPDLEARVTHLELDRRVAWELRGALPGTGEVNLAPSRGGTRITGFEEIDIEDARDPSTKAKMTRSFEAIWQLGWDSLRAAS